MPEPTMNNTREPGIIKFCDMVLTPRCFLSCRMCRAWKAPSDGPELSKAQAFQFVDELTAIAPPGLEINVMGGEPLAVDWCLDLCAHITSKGMKSIITTNGYMIDDEAARRIADSGLSVLAISLESLKPEIHDFYRGKVGVHERVMRAVEHLDRHCRGKLAISILTIMLDKNIDELVPLAHWVKKSGLFQNISYLALLETGLVEKRAKWYEQDVYRDLWPQDKPRLDTVIDEIKALRRAGFPIWNPQSQLDAFKEYYEEPDRFMRETEHKLGDHILDIDETGTIYMSGEPLGKSGAMPLGELWHSPEAWKVRQKLETRGPGKRACVINFVSSFPQDDHYQDKTASCVEVAPSSAPAVSKNDSIRTPRFSVIELVRACPLRCQMCQNWKSEPIRNPPSYEDLVRFVDGLDFVKRPFEINLAGGEALLYPRIFDLVGRIVSHGFTVSATTSGVLLNEGLLRKITASGLTYLPISLDSLDENVHDTLRGVRGTHQKAMSALERLLKDKGCLRNLTVQAIVMKSTYKGLPALVEWASARGIAVFLMALMRPNGLPVDVRWYQKPPANALWPEDEADVCRVIDGLIKMKAQGFRIDNQVAQLEAFKGYFRNPTVFVKNGSCSLGDGIVNVGPDGSIVLCWEKGPLGNIKTDNIQELWYSEQAAVRRDEIKACRRNCSEMVNCFFEQV